MNTFAKYRHNLPQLSQQFVISDGGLETTLVFRDGLDLPGFAAFIAPLLHQTTDQQILRQYFETYIGLAIANQVGMILESVTWRANLDWATQLGIQACLPVFWASASGQLPKIATTTIDG